MIERSRFGAESLQVLSETATRAGSEDGLEGIVDTAQELQLQLGEIALAGKSRALPALQSLGLTAAKLQQMEPEEAWRLVVEQIQQIPNVANQGHRRRGGFRWHQRKAGGNRQPDHRRICRP